MELIKLIVYLSLGTVIGWFANRMATVQRNRRGDKSTLSDDSSSEKS